MHCGWTPWYTTQIPPSAIKDVRIFKLLVELPILSPQLSNLFGVFFSCRKPSYLRSHPHSCDSLNTMTDWYGYNVPVLSFQLQTALTVHCIFRTSAGVSRGSIETILQLSFSLCSNLLLFFAFWRCWSQEYPVINYYMSIYI